MQRCLEAVDGLRRARSGSWNSSRMATFSDPRQGSRNCPASSSADRPAGRGRRIRPRAGRPCPSWDPGPPTYTLQGTVSYELDGGAASARCAGPAAERLYASDYDREAAELSVAATVARGWLGHRVTAAQLAGGAQHGGVAQGGARPPAVALRGRGDRRPAAAAGDRRRGGGARHGQGAGARRTNGSGTRWRCCSARIRRRSAAPACPSRRGLPMVPGGAGGPALGAAGAAARRAGQRSAADGGGRQPGGGADGVPALAQPVGQPGVGDQVAGRPAQGRHHASGRSAPTWSRRSSAADASRPGIAQVEAQQEQVLATLHQVGAHRLPRGLRRAGRPAQPARSDRSAATSSWRRGKRRSSWPSCGTTRATCPTSRCSTRSATSSPTEQVELGLKRDALTNAVDLMLALGGGWEDERRRVRRRPHLPLSRRRERGVCFWRGLPPPPRLRESRLGGGDELRAPPGNELPGYFTFRPLRGVRISRRAATGRWRRPAIHCRKPCRFKNGVEGRSPP